MPKPIIHAQRDVKQWGGKVEDYIAPHELMDSSKAAFPSHQHRVLCHNSWFIAEILPRIKFHNSDEYPDGKFHTITNSDGRQVSIRDIGESHCLLDFRGKFIPTVQDYLSRMPLDGWMLNGIDGYPPSYQECQNFQETHLKEVNIKLD